ncbi:MAG TPA: YihY/virulence factor BrkB family protein [Solirubrobacteraceae bacterium]|nr:YihY/virulence factor BrkB family protein [Solirubrobacteraceae bacterium]
MSPTTSLRGAIGLRLHAIDSAQQRHRASALPLAVIKKFGEDNGGQLAGLIAYYAFFSLFPLLLVLVTLLGLLLHGNPHLQNQIVHSSLASFPIIGTTIEKHLPSLNVGGLPLAIGIATALLAGLGVMHAMQIAQDRMWDVAPARRNSFLRTRLRGLALLAILGSVNIAATVIVGWVDAGSAPGVVGTLAALVVSTALDLGLFVAAFVLLTSYPATVREILPGAVLATILWQLLQHAGGYIVVHQLKHFADVYSLFAIVLGTLAWLHLGAQATLYSAELNVVRSKGLWPRRLLGESDPAPPPSEAL